MARKRRNFNAPLENAEPVTIRNTAELNTPPEAPTDLLSAWQGHTRGFADQPAADPDGDSDALFAQLRTIADDLERPASSSTPRLLSAGESDIISDAVFASDGATQSSYDGTYAAPQADLAMLREYIEGAERRLASVIAANQQSLAVALRESREGIAETISTAMSAREESLAAELRASHDRMTSALQTNHAPVEVGLVALLESLETVERRLSGNVSERHEQASEGRQQLIDELRGSHDRITGLLETQAEAITGRLETQVAAIVASQEALTGRLETHAAAIVGSQDAMMDRLETHAATIAAKQESITTAIRREIAEAAAGTSEALLKLELELANKTSQLHDGRTADITGVLAQLAEVKSFVENQVGAIAEQTRSLNEQLSAGEVARLPALFHELRTDLEVSESELLAGAEREEQARADADTRESEAREAESAAALQRAIGMLSVLESLDEVVASLQGRSDSESLKRLQHFERQTREMARLVELEDIPAEGTVDPERHEVVSTVRASAAPGTILDLLQRGYSFRGRVVRPAQVVAAE